MTEPTKPVASPSKRNPSKPAMAMRDAVTDSAVTLATTNVVDTWRKLMGNEPKFMELLLPKEMREALEALSQAWSTPAAVRALDEIVKEPKP